MTPVRRVVVVALLGTAVLTPLARGAAAAGDTTPPAITPALAGTSGANGWYTSAVDISWTVADPESAVVATSGCDAATVSSETAATSLTCTATNADGLVSAVTATVKIDLTPPDVTGATPSSPPQRQGWHVAPLTMQFSGSDSVSGIATCSSVPYAGPDTKQTTLSGSCTNNAGLSASGTATLKFDASGPVVTPQVSGTAGNNGWYRSDVSVSWAVDDPHSGLWQTSGCSPATVTGDTGGTTLTCSGTNDAGTQSAASVTIKIDRTPPDTSINGGPSGTVASRDAAFTLGSTDGAAFECSLDGASFAACSSQPTYGGLADGTHTFVVRAVDEAGNVDPTPATRSWTVHVRVVRLVLPADRRVEAAGPAGTPVTYAVSGTSDGEPLAPALISCTPGSGSTFPLGRTVVTCTANDATGAAASGSFAVTVVDTTPPNVVVPRPLTITSGAPIPSSDPRVAAFATGATAHDLVDLAPIVTPPLLPPSLPLGRTELEFSARDAAGNVTRERSSITIAPPGASSPPTPPSTPSPSPPATGSPPAEPDRVPPANVQLKAVRPGDRRVTLGWALPADPDLARVELRRSTSEPGAVRTLVYSGRGATFVDRGLTNGVDYQYLFVTVDQSGNRARGIVVVATPKPSLLLAPKDGTIVRTPPLLRWAAVAGATYYNVQLHRGGRKILTVWPRSPRLRLAATWKLGRTRFRLTPGVYRWYVWAGTGEPAARSYGPILGEATFIRR